MKSNIKINISEKAKYYMNRLSLAGKKAFIVGGYVRDSILGVRPKDVDIFVEQCNLEDLLPEGSVIGGESRRDKMQTIALPGDVEVSVFRGDGKRNESGKSIAQHCRTCDLTVNSLAADKDGNVYDFTGGIEDLNNRVLRTVGHPLDRFKEDWIRIPRLMRQYCDGIWKLDPVTYYNAYHNTGLVTKQPVERFMAEFMKALQKDDPTPFLEFMWETELMGYYFPEYEGINDMLQNPKYHNKGLSGHIKDVTFNADKSIRLYAFLHDYGKKRTAKRTEDGYFKFKGHDKVGGELIPELFRKLRLPNEQMHIAKAVCEMHMEAYKLDSPASIRRFQLKAGSNLDVIREVCIADCKGRKELDTSVFDPLPEVTQFKPIIDGKYLIKKGYREGRELGRVKKACMEVQLALGLSDPEHIYDLATEIL